MLKRFRNVDLIVKTCMKVKPKQHVLVIADDAAGSVSVGRQMAQACDSEGAEVGAPHFGDGPSPNFDSYEQ